MTMHVFAVPGIPEISEGDDLGRVIGAALATADLALEPGDVLVVASKIVAKALGLRRYASRDSVIADETVRVVAERVAEDRVTRVVEAASGPVMAAAGVDESNLGAAGGVLVLPRDPDAAAAAVLDSLREALGWDEDHALGVIVSDTAGRPWRTGVVDFALGSAGVVVLDDHRGAADADGRPLSVTVIAVADEIAAAADLVKGKAASEPVAVVRGLAWATTDPTVEGASSLVRTGPGDWFRTGPVEAVRAALGVEPGSADSESVGIRSVAAQSLEDRVERLLRLARHTLPEVTGVVVGSSLTVASEDPYLLGQAVARVRVGAASEGLVVASEVRAPTSAALVVVDPEAAGS